MFRFSSTTLLDLQCPVLSTITNSTGLMMCLRKCQLTYQQHQQQRHQQLRQQQLLLQLNHIVIDQNLTLTI